MGGGRLRDVVAHGGSNVLVLTRENKIHIFKQKPVINCVCKGHRDKIRNRKVRI